VVAGSSPVAHPWKPAACGGFSHFGGARGGARVPKSGHRAATAGDATPLMSGVAWCASATTGGRGSQISRESAGRGSRHDRRAAARRVPSTVLAVVPRGRLWRAGGSCLRSRPSAT